MRKNSNLIRWISIAILACFITATGVYAIENTSITGKVIKTESGVVLIRTADEEQYIVIGSNLSKMVGKKVKATGTVLNSPNGKSIMVVKVKEVKK